MFPENMKPRLSIGVVTHNDLKALPGFFESLYRTTPAHDFELLIYDDNSTDGTRAFLHIQMEHKSNIQLFESNNENTYCRDMRVLWLLAGGKYFACVNPDITFAEPDWHKRAIEILESDSDIYAIGTGGGCLNRKGIGRESQPGERPDFIAGYFIFCEKSKLDSIGGLYGLDFEAGMYCEELIWDCGSTRPGNGL